MSFVCESSQIRDHSPLHIFKKLSKLIVITAYINENKKYANINSKKKFLVVSLFPSNVSLSSQIGENTLLIMSGTAVSLGRIAEHVVKKET